MIIFYSLISYELYELLSALVLALRNFVGTHGHLSLKMCCGFCLYVPITLTKGTLMRGGASTLRRFHFEFLLSLIPNGNAWPLGVIVYPNLLTLFTPSFLACLVNESNYGDHDLYIQYDVQSSYIDLESDIIIC